MDSVLVMSLGYVIHRSAQSRKLSLCKLNFKLHCSWQGDSSVVVVQRSREQAQRSDILTGMKQITIVIHASMLTAPMVQYTTRCRPLASTHSLLSPLCAPTTTPRLQHLLLFLLLFAEVRE